MESAKHKNYALPIAMMFALVREDFVRDRIGPIRSA